MSVGGRFGSNAALALARDAAVSDTRFLSCDTKISGNGSISTRCSTKDCRRRLLPDSATVAQMIEDRREYQLLDRYAKAKFCWERYWLAAGKHPTVLIRGVHVCRGAFIYYYGITDYRIRESAIHLGAIRTTRPAIPRPPTKGKHAADWIASFVKLAACRSPTKVGVAYLAVPSINSVYPLYIASCGESKKPAVGASRFQQIWVAQFGPQKKRSEKFKSNCWVKMRGDAEVGTRKCKHCANYHAVCGDPLATRDEIRIAAKEQTSHIKAMSAQRAWYSRSADLARAGKAVSIGMDATSSWATSQPFCRQASGGAPKPGVPIDFKIMNVCIHGGAGNGRSQDDHVLRIGSPPWLRSGADLTISIICAHVLPYITNKYPGGNHPRVLYIQTDGGSDMANKTMIFFLHYLIDEKVFDEIYHTRLPVGHGHADFDAAVRALPPRSPQNCFYR